MSIQTIKFEQFASKQFQNLMEIAYKSQIIETQPYQLFLRQLSQKIDQILSKQKKKLFSLIHFHEILLKEKSQQQLHIRIQQYIQKINPAQYQQKQCKECLIEQNDIFWKHIEIVYNSYVIDIFKKANKKVQQIVEKFHLKATTFKQTDLLNMSMIKLFYGSYKEAAKDINSMNPNKNKNNVDWIIAAFIGKIVKKTNIQQIAWKYMISYKPKQILFYIFLGDLSYYQKNQEVAIKYYKKALDYCDQNRQIIYYKLGIIKKQTSMYQQAIINLKEAIKINDEILMFHITMAQTYQYYLTKQATQMASQILQKVSKKIQIQKINNQSKEIPRIIYEHYSNVWFQMNSYKNYNHNNKQYKRNHTWKVMRKNPYVMSQQDIQQSKKYLKLAQFYIKANLIQKAKYIYNNLINNYIFNKLIMSQVDQNNIKKLILDKKIDQYQRSKRKIEKPSQIDEHFQNIKYLLQKDQFDNLKQLLKLLLVKYQQNNIISSKLYYFYGQLYKKRQKYNLSLQNYRESLDHYDINKKSYQKIIQVYIILNKTNQLQQICKIAIQKLAQRHPAIQLQLAKIQQEKGRYDMAKRMYQGVIQCDKGNKFAEPYARIGIINYKLKLYSEARDILQKGLQILIKPENDSSQLKNDVFQNIEGQDNKIIYLIMIEYLSKSYYELKNYNQAKEYGLIYIKKSQIKNSNIYKILGEVQYDEQDYERSLEYFNISFQVQQNQEVCFYIIKIQEQQGQSLTKSSQLIQETLYRHDFSKDILYKYLEVNFKIIKPQQIINAKTIFNYMSQMFQNLKSKLNSVDSLQLSFVSQNESFFSKLSWNYLLDYQFCPSQSEKQNSRYFKSQSIDEMINKDQSSCNNNNSSGSQYPNCQLQYIDQSFNHNISEQLSEALNLINHHQRSTNLDLIYHGNLILIEYR